MSLSLLVPELQYFTFRCHLPPNLSLTYLPLVTSSLPCQGACLTCMIRNSRRFRNVGQAMWACSIEVVCQAILRASLSSVSSPSLSCLVPPGERPTSTSGYLRSQILWLGKVSLSLRFTSKQPAVPSSLQSLARSPPSLYTINARNQPPVEMAGVRFLSCIRCRTKRRRRLCDLPLSRNNTSPSSLTPG